MCLACGCLVCSVKVGYNEEKCQQRWINYVWEQHTAGKPHRIKHEEYLDNAFKAQMNEAEYIKNPVAVAARLIDELCRNLNIH